MLDLGASLCIIHNEPDGTNINDKCGSTHMDDLKEMVVQNGRISGSPLTGTLTAVWLWMKRAT